MSGGAAAAGSGDWHSPADRLALFMQRYSVAEDKVAQQLGWPLEKLQAYLSPEARRLKAASDIVDTAVEKLLMRYRISLAHQTLAKATVKPLAPVYGAARQSNVPAQFGCSNSDPRSIIHADATPAQLKAAAEVDQQASNLSTSSSNRKRKRKVIVKPLATAAAVALPPNTEDNATDSGSSAEPQSSQQTAWKPPRQTPEMICPIRLDVDLDGVRYQDTFLLNAANPTSSPEAIAAQIAYDEKLSDRLKDTIAESVRRQIMAFTSCVSPEPMTGRLYPIYIDLLIDGFSLRDQFEWDITNNCNAAQEFAATLCADLNLPRVFESAIVFSICEQAAAYRSVLCGRKWIGNNPFRMKGAGATLSTSSAGYIETMPPLDGVIREEDDTILWQPVLSELSTEEQKYLSARLAAARAPTSWKRAPIPSHASSGRTFKRQARVIPKEDRLPRPINPFIMYCQVQKEIFNKSKTRRSASETRKIMGDMWRKCTDEDKEYYSQLTEVENEKRRREHLVEMRDRMIGEWEEDEARRKGLLASTTLEASTEHCRGLLLENYMSERHDVDMNREPPLDETEEDIAKDEVDL